MPSPCRIDLNFVIKVADFGLSETIDPTREYFRQENSNTIKLPFKWLSPESLREGVFSEKTDVVSLYYVIKMGHVLFGKNRLTRPIAAWPHHFLGSIDL